MDESTRAEALKKLATFEPHVGHPAKWRDYAVLALLHGSLALRIVGGDLFGVELLRLVGGVLGVVTLLAFVANAASSAYGARRVGHRPVVAAAPTTFQLQEDRR